MENELANAIRDFDLHVESATDGRRRYRYDAFGTPTHCQRGHSLHDAYRHKRGDGSTRLKCRTCTREQARKWRDQNPERALELQRMAAERDRARGGKRTRKKTWRERKYNLTEAQFEAMLAAQESKCPLCCVDLTTAMQIDGGGRPVLQRNSAVVDHDHATGAVRGILCVPCNRGLGDFRDNRDALRRAAEYLERASS